MVPDHSPERSVPKEEVVPRGLTKEDLKDKNAGKTAEELEKERKRLEAQSHAVVLEMIGDLPDADVKPPENVLFVCQLNPVTEDEDLRMIFFRFGVKSCEIIRDHETGNSLGYAFIEFSSPEECRRAAMHCRREVFDGGHLYTSPIDSLMKSNEDSVRRHGEIV